MIVDCKNKIRPVFLHGGEKANNGLIAETVVVYKGNTLNYETKKLSPHQFRQISFDLLENFIIKLRQVERFHFRKLFDC